MVEQELWGCRTLSVLRFLRFHQLPQRRILSKQKYAVDAERFGRHAAHRHLRLTVWTVSYPLIVIRSTGR